jgi:outer membrane receptor protein involved in Fe transport
VTLLNSKINDGIYKNSKIPGTSNAIFNLGAEFYPIDKLQASANYSYRGSQYAISDFYNKKDKQKGYSVVNVDLKYNVNTNFIVQLGINNLFNEKYNDYTVYSSLSNKLASYPADERTYYIKFDYILDGGKKNE